MVLEGLIAEFLVSSLYLAKSPMLGIGDFNFEGVCSAVSLDIYFDWLRFAETWLVTAFLLGVIWDIRFPVVGSKRRLVDSGLEVEELDGKGGRWPWLVLGRILLRDDVGRDDGATGLSAGKKLDLRLRGDGEGGIWERVSIVLSDKEGLGRLGSVRDLAGESGRTSILLATNVLAVGEEVIAG